MIHKSLAADIVGIAIGLSVGWSGSCKECLEEGMSSLGADMNSWVVLGRTLMEASSCWKLVECKSLMGPERIEFDTELETVRERNAPWLARNAAWLVRIAPWLANSFCLAANIHLMA